METFLTKGKKNIMNSYASTVTSSPKTSTTHFAYSNLKRLIKEESIVVIPGDKDSCAVIMDKIDYVKKTTKYSRRRN